MEEERRKVQQQIEIDKPEYDESSIRERYLGKQKEKKPLRKFSEKRFNFDWDAKDDTFKEDDELYAKRKDYSLYGRARVAGLDSSLQTQDFYKNLTDSRQTVQGLQRRKELEEIRLKKEAKGRLDDRHWLEKPLSKMTDRDWRIFKEDFNISTKGGSIPHPIRFWDESDLPATIRELIYSVGYEDPTPIQRQAIPIALMNRDLIGIAGIKLERL
jgi:ATP-dependent RNA helicase DDX23/PRP28